MLQVASFEEDPALTVIWYDKDVKVSMKTMWTYVGYVGLLFFSNVCRQVQIGFSIPI